MRDEARRAEGRQVTCIPSHWQSRSEGGPLPHVTRDRLHATSASSPRIETFLLNLEPHADRSYHG